MSSLVFSLQLDYSNPYSIVIVDDIENGESGGVAAPITYGFDETYFDETYFDTGADGT